MAIKTNKSIFYHIPKTGGSWVTNVMRRSLSKTNNFKFERPPLYLGIEENEYWGYRLSEILGMRKAHTTQWATSKENKDGLFSFAFVREPISWYKSWWINRLNDKTYKKVGQDWRDFLLDFAWDYNFERFVINSIKMFPTGALTTIYKCFLGKDGNALNFVGKQENLREDLIEALTLAGEDFDENLVRKLGRINPAKKLPGFNYERALRLGAKLEGELRKREGWIIKTFYG